MERNTSRPELMQDTINRLTMRVNELEDLVDQLAVPIIPSILPKTVLIPVAGELSPERFQMIIPKILNHVHNEGNESVIIDFTALTIKDAELDVLGTYIQNLTASLHLMGAEVLVVGFSPQFSQELVKSGLPFTNDLKAFSTFKTALQFLMKKKGLALIKTD
ncbi:STAS domain-containing protein [Bacillus sp. V5-8f]|uniref:STAS domain-containing protein n=1 Tax=Bacillus sp. V5-8f TaxID=2053044 RepID=UPI000C7938A3|nr:STAS domain-containing protein [Bacillus sp. V5-8f]PLT33499.1 histidine kinase [Bacillus sp. V5-8f]